MKRKYVPIMLAPALPRTGMVSNGWTRMIPASVRSRQSAATAPYSRGTVRIASTTVRGSIPRRAGARRQAARNAMGR